MEDNTRALPEELEGFGLDHPDAWLNHAREAQQSEPQVQIHEYEIIEEIARGGQGIVFRARQPRTGRDVALKRLTQGAYASPTAQARFLREIQTASTLSHPNLVTVYAAQVVDGAMTLAMEWIDGKPIDEWAETPEPKPIRTVLEVFLKTCEAVRHAHQRGIIHRDLKPGNILVDMQNEPHVLDFGLAKVLRGGDQPGAALTLSEDFVGTPAYASPEQVEQRAGAVDVRTDVYALGAVLYQLLTGRLPHDPTQSLPDLFEAIRHADVSSPSLHRVGLNRELDAITLKALEKDLDARYPSVEALVADIRRYLAGDAVLAHPPSTGYRLKKMIRRNKLAFAFVVLMIVSAVTSTALYVQAREQRRLADNSAIAARQQAEKVLAINTFLRKMLASARPETARGRELTVREMLDQSAADIEAGALGDRPVIEAGVRSTIGQTYMALDLPNLAEPHLRRAYETFVRVAGPGDPQTLLSLKELANLDVKRLNFDDAEAKYRSIIAATEASPDAGRVDVARSHDSLGFLLLCQGRNDEAAGAFRRSLELHQTASARLPVEIAEVMDNLAQALVNMHQIDAAMGVSKESVETVRRELQQNDPRLVTILHNHALLLRMAGDLTAAETLAREVVAASNQIYAPGHMQRMRATNSLAGVLHQSGQQEEAETLYNEVLERARDPETGDLKTALVCLNNLANLMTVQGRLDEAEPVYRDLLATQRKVLDPHHPNLAWSLYDYGWLLCDRNAHERAVPVFRESLAIWRTMPAAQAPDMAVSLAALGQTLLTTGDYKEAESLLRECLEIRRRASPDTWQYFGTLSNLGEALAKQGEFAEARDRLNEARDGLTANASAPAPILETVMRRIKALDALERQ